MATLTESQSDAVAYLESLLSRYGLPGLAKWAYNQVIAGHSPVVIEQLLRDTKQFKKRFWMIVEREEKGLPPISPGEVIAYEGQAQQLFRAAGIPEALWTKPQYIGQLIADNVSLAEMNERINRGFIEVAYAPKEVREMFAEYFGIKGDGALAAFFLDPDTALPELERMAEQAIIGGTAKRFGFDFDKDRAGRFAELDITRDRLEEGFQKLDVIRPLFTETISETEDFEADEEGAGAVFGLDAKSTGKLKKRADERVARMSGSGGAFRTQEGTGMGAAY